MRARSSLLDNWYAMALSIIALLVAMAPSQALGQASDAATTDSNGTTVLSSLGVALPVQALDEDTGKPVSGLAVAVAQDPVRPGRAVLLVADGSQRYPFQFIVLEAPSQAPLSTTSSSVAGSQSEGGVTVPVRSGGESVLTGVRHALQTGLLGALPPPQPNSNDFINLFFTAAQALTRSDKVILPPPLSGVLPSLEVSDSMPVSQYLDSFRAKVANDMAENLADWLLKAPIEELPIENLYGGIGDPLLPDLVRQVATSFYEQIGASSIVLVNVKFAGIAVDIPVPIFDSPPVNPFPQSPNLHVTAQTADNSPLAGGSFELISTDSLGVAVAGVLDSQGNADIPVPAGNYLTRVGSNGFIPHVDNVLVSQTGTTTESAILNRLGHRHSLSFRSVSPVALIQAPDKW